MNGMAGPSASQFQKRVPMNDISVAEELLTLNLLPYDLYFAKGTLSENLPDEVCKKMKTLYESWDATNIYAMAATKTPSFKFLVVLNLTQFLSEHPISSDI